MFWYKVTYRNLIIDIKIFFQFSFFFDHSRCESSKMLSLTEGKWLVCKWLKIKNGGLFFNNTTPRSPFCYVSRLFMLKETDDNKGNVPGNFIYELVVVLRIICVHFFLVMYVFSLVVRFTIKYLKVLKTTLNGHIQMLFTNYIDLNT